MWLTIIVGAGLRCTDSGIYGNIHFGHGLGHLDILIFRLNCCHGLSAQPMVYGIVSLVLGLAVEGYMPTRVADAGGWLAFLRMTRRLRDADLVDRSRFVLTQSPYGKVTRIVYQEVRVNNRPLLEVHGGLANAACFAPLQIVLIMLPLLVLRFVPGEWLQDHACLNWPSWSI